MNPKHAQDFEYFTCIIITHTHSQGEEWRKNTFICIIIMHGHTHTHILQGEEYSVPPHAVAATFSLALSCACKVLSVKCKPIQQQQQFHMHACAQPQQKGECNQGDQACRGDIACILITHTATRKEYYKSKPPHYSSNANLVMFVLRVLLCVCTDALAPWHERWCMTGGGGGCVCSFLWALY